MDIYGTIGPACLDKNILKDMFQMGMTGMRLNLSHITLSDAKDMVDLFHKAAQEADVSHPKLLIDMQGPELRIGELKEKITLCENDTVLLGKEGIPIPEVVYPYLEKGRKILLNDGKILLEVIEDTTQMAVSSKEEGEEEKTSYLCTVLRGGVLSGRKSIAMEDVMIRTPTLTGQDMENLRHAKQFGVTGVMQPFVRNQQDLLTLRTAMKEAGCEDLSVFAKIENINGIEHLEEFMELADEIVIARGDLGNAMPLWELPKVQKKIASICRKKKKPFMVVTQMLASMEQSAVPTGAEVSDIYNAVLDGASSVMVTGETAIGRYPVEVIRYLHHTAHEALLYHQMAGKDSVSFA